MIVRGLVLLTLGLVAAAPEARAQSCLRFGEPRRVGAFTNAEILESSGLVASVHRPGVRFTHNDSGDTARLFVLGADGADLGVVGLDDAAHVDWEDLALGPCDEARACLYVGDVGDNAARRETVEVYRVPEPEAGAASAGAAARWTLTYPDGPRDVEAVLVDPRTSDLFLVEKTDAVAARLAVLRGAGTATGGVSGLEPLGAVEVEGFVTGGDFDPTGAQVVLRTYGGQAWRGVARRDATGAVTGFERLDAPEVDPLGEAIAWRADGLALLTTREGQGALLYETPCLDPDGSTPGPAVGPLVEVAPEPSPPSGCRTGGGLGAGGLWLLGLGAVRARRRRSGRARR